MEFYWSDLFYFENLDIEKDFKKQLQAFVPELFRSDNINFVKEINGEQITSTQLFEYFRVSRILINNWQDYNELEWVYMLSNNTFELRSAPRWI
jgi:2-iminoacetate synthase ThiH